MRRSDMAPKKSEATRAAERAMRADVRRVRFTECPYYDIQVLSMREAVADEVAGRTRCHNPT